MAVPFCWWSCESVFCCETTAKHSYEILLFFRFTAWKCFEFVKISKLLAKVTQNFKHRAVFLVTVPGNEAKICPFGLSGTDTAKSRYQWGLGLGFHSTCIRNWLHDSTDEHRDLQQHCQWHNTGVYMGAWGRRSHGEIRERGQFLLQLPLLTYQRNFQAHKTQKE